METVERWWNNTWGRLARLNLWLKSDGTNWRVEARRGDGDAKVWARDFGRDEAAARALVDKMKARGSDNWVNLATKRQRQAETDVCPACDAAPGSLHIELRPPPRPPQNLVAHDKPRALRPIPWLLCQVCGLVAPGELKGGLVVFDLWRATQLGPPNPSPGQGQSRQREGA